MSSDPRSSSLRSAAEPDSFRGSVEPGTAHGEKDGLAGLVNVAGEYYVKGADRAQEALDELPATLSDASVAGERIIRSGRRHLRRRVNKQPLEALLLAGAIGYLAGWIARRG